jgi:hypothetical protein
LLVFPVTEGLYTTDHLNFDETEWIEWEDVSSIWKAAIPGTDDVKEDAVQILASHWHKYVPIKLIGILIDIIFIPPPPPLIQNHYQH